ncbi:MAG: hypothetical protein WCG80_07840 [Spirochaetales bacterium]
MDLLEKRITSEWIEIREKLSLPSKLKQYLKLDDLKIQTLPATLRAASMEGVVEVKKKFANGVFTFLTRLSFTTPDQAEILAIEGELRLLVYLLSVQVLYAQGQLKPNKEVEGELAGTSSRNRVPVEQVIQEVKNRIGGNPELAKNIHVKNIFMEIQLYQKEFGNFAQMSPQIPDDRAATFFMNYKKRLDSILDNVHMHYREIQMAEDEAMRKEFQRQEEDQFVLPELAKLLQQQAHEMSRVRATIFHAIQEGSQVRKILLKLVELQAPFITLLEEELRMLDSRQDTAARGHPAAVKLGRNMAVSLESNSLKKIG